MLPSPEEQKELLGPLAYTSIKEILSTSSGPERNTKLEEFTKMRLGQLEERSVIATIDADSGIIHAFIHPESILKPIPSVPGFRLDDSSIYTMLLEELQQFHDDPSWAGSSERDVVPYAVLRTVTHYYGGIPDDDDMLSQYKELYLMLEKLDMEARKYDPNASIDSISMEVFKDGEIAHCLERASTAHNLFQFLGFKSYVVFSENCRFSEKGIIGHAYNIIRERDGLFITDPTNPVNFFNEDGTPLNNYASIHPIPQEDFTKIANKGQVPVAVQNYKVKNGKAQPIRQETWLYGG